MALPTPIPHPLSFFDAPGWLGDALDWVVGVDWPEGNEKAMRDLADEWHAAAQRLGPLLDEADHAALSAVAAFGGPEGREAQALLALWRKLGSGPESAMVVVNEFLAELGNLVDAGANEIEGVKLEFYIELALLLIELLALIATAVFTFGGSLAAAGPIMLATRFAIQQILRRATKELVERTVKKSLQEKAKSRLAAFGQHPFREALEEGLQELGASGGIQAYQISEGNRAGFDPKELATSFGLGTLGGAVANVTSVGGVKATTMSGRFGEKALRSATGEMLAETSIGVVTGQGVTWTSLGMAASSASVGSVVGDGRHVIDALSSGPDAGLLSANTLIPGDPSAGLSAVSEVGLLSGAPPTPGDSSTGLSAVSDVGLPSGTPPISGGMPTGVTDADLLSAPTPLPGDPSTFLSAVSDEGAVSATMPVPGADTVAAVSSGEALLPAFPADTTRIPDLAVSTDPSPRTSAAPPEPVPARSSWEPPRTVLGIGDDRPLTSAPPAAVAGAPMLSAADRTATLTPAVDSSPDASPAGITPVGAAPPAGAAPHAAAVPAAAPSVAGPAHAAPPTHPMPPPAHHAAPSVPPIAPPSGAGPSAAAVRVPDGGTVPDEPIVFHTWLLADVATKPVAPQPVPVVPEPLVPEDPYEWAFYAGTVRGEIQAALKRRLFKLIDKLMIDWPERSRNLRENAIAALTQEDLEDIAGELWQIANSDSLEPRVRLAQGGLIDWSATSLATGTDHPPATEATRRYNEPGGYRRPLALHQQDVELAIPRDENGRPQRFGDLNGDWLRRINDGGPAADLSRGINCTDVVLSVLDTWLHGRPRVAAPRTVDKFTLDDSLRPLGGEPGGVHRIEAATGGYFESLSSDRPGFARLEEVLGLHGHGSCAVLVQQWPNGDSHATTVHNQNGKIIYVDAQRPEAPIIGGPPFGADRMQVLLLDPSATPIELGTGRVTWDVDPEGPPRAHSKPVTDLDRMMRDPTPEELAALGVGNAIAADLGLAEADLSPKQRAELPQVAVLHPRQLAFTQRSVSAATSDGVAATDLERRLAADGWRGDPVHAVLWGDGSLASLDHRRLRAALRANLHRLPVVIHAPSDPVTAWGENGEHLADDLRRLPDNSLIVGGDEGEVIYSKGAIPTTCGEAALFRAADQRSLLPGHLFGTKQEPLTLEKPPGRRAPPIVPESVTAMLHQLRAEAETQADPIQADLESLGAPMHNVESRIKSFESLAQKYDREYQRFGGDPQEFAASYGNDVLRYTLILPDGPGYTDQLLTSVEALGAKRYVVEAMKNFWAAGNRFYGVNATVRSPAGQLFEIQFLSELTKRASEMTHELYEIVRRDDELVARRSHAFMNILAVNKRLGLPLSVPPGLSAHFPQADRSMQSWIARHPAVWRRYRIWLEENGRTLSATLEEFGLAAGDVEFRPEALGG